MSFARASRFQSAKDGRRDSPSGRKNVPIKARGIVPSKPFQPHLCTCPWKKPYTHDQIGRAVSKARQMGAEIYSYLCACDRYHVTSQPQRKESPFEECLTSATFDSLPTTTMTITTKGHR